MPRRLNTTTTTTTTTTRWRLRYRTTPGQCRKPHHERLLQLKAAPAMLVDTEPGIYRNSLADGPDDAVLLLSGLDLALTEASRRDANRALGLAGIGCRQIDIDILAVGGFERGCVVGISTVDERDGLIMALQILARFLLQNPPPTNSCALVISAQHPAPLAALLRDASRAQSPDPCYVRACLERVSLTRVFDLAGLREALDEAEGLYTAVPATPEVPDSQDEHESSALVTPAIVIVADVATLLTGHFASYAAPDRSASIAAAYDAVRNLSARLRRLSRQPSSKPLVILLNACISSPNGDGTMGSLFLDSPFRPAFGRVFAQMLDLHLLCTRRLLDSDKPDSFCIVVEVLEDALGAWEGRLGPRLYRETRWGAVELVDGCRMTDVRH